MGRGIGIATLVLALAAAPAPAAEDAAALLAKFQDALAAGKVPDAHASGRKLLAEAPEDPACLAVLRAFLEREWPVPRLRTSFPVLKRWEADVVDGRREPDLRLALIDDIESRFPKEDHVSEGGTTYEKAWTHLQAKRPEEAIRWARLYLSRWPDGGSVDKVRLVLADALVAKSPPDPAAARKVLEAVAGNPRSRYRERAARLLDDLAAGARWIDVADGCPRAEGLGRIAILTDLPADDPFLKALAGWREARGAEVVRFRTGRVRDADDDLRKSGPEFVAVVTRAERVDFNLHAEILLLCRDLDGDPMPDFQFGYLVARDAADLAALAARSLDSRPAEQPKVAMVSPTKDLAGLADLDAAFHIGHGTPTGIVDGPDAAAVAAAKLPRGTVIVSGACFNGVVGRSWHPNALQPRFLPPVEYRPDEVLSLAWIHAGARGVVAAMEGDRGEMAGAEWTWLRSTACALGEVPGLSYRLAFASLPETWAGLPRQEAGKARSLALYDVMLRGLLSRALVGDPSLRPLGAPAGDEALKADVRRETDGRIVVEVEPTAAAALGEAVFLTVNTLTSGGFSGNAFTERRVFARVELPADLAGRLGAPQVRIDAGGRALVALRTSVRHEVWGGRRWVCVQAESADLALSAPGTRTTFSFPVGGSK